MIATDRTACKRPDNVEERHRVTQYKVVVHQNDRSGTLHPLGGSGRVVATLYPGSRRHIKQIG